MCCTSRIGQRSDLLDEWSAELRQGPRSLAELVDAALRRGVALADAQRLVIELAAGPAFDLERGPRGEPRVRMVAP